MKYVLKVWRKEYNVRNIKNRYDYQYSLPYWSDLYENFNKDILKKCFIKDVDGSQVVYASACPEIHDYNYKKLIFKVPRKNKKEFLLAIARFKAYLSKYFYFQG